MNLQIIKKCKASRSLPRPCVAMPTAAKNIFQFTFEHGLAMHRPDQHCPDMQSEPKIFCHFSMKRRAAKRSTVLPRNAYTSKAKILCQFTSELSVVNTCAARP